MRPGDLPHALFLLVKTSGFYGGEAAESRRRLEEAAEVFDSGLTAEPELELSAREGELYLGDKPVPSSAARDFLADKLESLGIATLRFSRGFDARGLARLAAGLQPSGGSLAEIPHLKVLRDEDKRDAEDEEEGGAPGAPPPAPDARAAASRAFTRALSTVQETMTLLREGKAADFEPARGAVSELIERLTRDPQSLLELTLLRDYDQYTFAHSVNVSVYSIAVGMELDLSRPLLAELGFAALFHDVGKVRLPIALIEKPGELDNDEWRRLRRHPALGALVLLENGSGLDRAWARAVAVAFEHHLRYDGSGYPAPRWPRRQNLFSRICALADSFDAMTSGRVYSRRALSPDEALRRLEAGKGASYDPDLVPVFEAAVGGRIVAAINR